MLTAAADLGSPEDAVLAYLSCTLSANITVEVAVPTSASNTTSTSGPAAPAPAAPAPAAASSQRRSLWYAGDELQYGDEATIHTVVEDITGGGDGEVVLALGLERHQLQQFISPEDLAQQESVVSAPEPTSRSASTTTVPPSTTTITTRKPATSMMVSEGLKRAVAINEADRASSSLSKVLRGGTSLSYRVDKLLPGWLESVPSYTTLTSKGRIAAADVPRASGRHSPLPYTATAGGLRSATPAVVAVKALAAAAMHAESRMAEVVRQLSVVRQAGGDFRPIRGRVLQETSPTCAAAAAALAAHVTAAAPPPSGRIVALPPAAPPPLSPPPSVQSGFENVLSVGSVTSSCMTPAVNKMAVVLAELVGTAAALVDLNTKVVEMVTSSGTVISQIEEKFQQYDNSVLQAYSELKVHWVRLR